MMMSLVLENEAKTEQVSTGAEFTALNGGEYSQNIATTVKVEKWIIVQL